MLLVNQRRHKASKAVDGIIIKYVTWGVKKCKANQKQ